MSILDGEFICNDAINNKYTDRWMISYDRQLSFWSGLFSLLFANDIEFVHFPSYIHRYIDNTEGNVWMYAVVYHSR